MDNGSPQQQPPPLKFSSKPPVLHPPMCCNGAGPPLPPRGCRGIPHSKSNDSDLHVSPLDLLSSKGIDPMLLIQLQNLNRHLNMQQHHHQRQQQLQSQRQRYKQQRVNTIPMPTKRVPNVLPLSGCSSNTAERLPLHELVHGPSSNHEFMHGPSSNSFKRPQTGSSRLNAYPNHSALPGTRHTPMAVRDETKIYVPEPVPLVTEPAAITEAGFCPTTGANGRQVPIEAHYYRKPAMIVSIIDAIFATSLLVFHGLTLMVQEMPNEGSPNDNWLLPKIPMTPGELTITGYMEVIAWIGILGVNFTQLLVAVGLYNGCEKDSEVLKTFESSRVYIKTSAFIIIILAIKLCILYFMHQMNMVAVWTAVFTAIETIFRISGTVIVFRFFLEIKTNYPMITEIYLTPADDGLPKTNPVSDAVWF